MGKTNKVGFSKLEDRFTSPAYYRIAEKLGSESVKEIGRQRPDLVEKYATLRDQRSMRSPFAWLDLKMHLIVSTDSTSFTMDLALEEDPDVETRKSNNMLDETRNLLDELVVLYDKGAGIALAETKDEAEIMKKMDSKDFRDSIERQMYGSYENAMAYSERIDKADAEFFGFVARVSNKLGAAGIGDGLGLPRSDIYVEMRKEIAEVKRKIYRQMFDGRK
jgi:hypothetical protein